MNIDEKIWYLELDGKREGPFSPRQIRENPRVTPDTLVWREGFKKWVPLRFVAELKDIFKDEEPAEEPRGKSLRPLLLPDDEVALGVQSQPPFLFFLLLLAALLFLYFFYVARLL